MKKSFAFILFILTLASFAKPPSVMLVYPAGGQKGSVFKATIGALDADGATGVAVTGEGVNVKILKISEMPKERLDAAAKRDEAKGMKFIEVEISIDEKAEEGVRMLSVASDEGSSNNYFFHVGNLPEAMEKEDNSSIKNAQTIEKLPATINGQCYEGDRDFFKVKLKQGSHIVFDAKARRIRPYLADAVPGWFQASLRLYDEKGNSVFYVDDYQNSPDPTMVYEVKKSGVYIVEIKDALYRGRDDFVYRIDIGELPHIKAIFPCGGNQDEKTKVKLLGVNLPFDTLTVAREKGDSDIKQVKIKNKNLISNPVLFAFDTLPESTLESSDTPSEKITEIPCVLNGIIENPYENFWVRFKAKKGEKIIFEVFSSRLAYPCDAKLALYKASNMELLSQNDDIDDPSFGLVTAQVDPRIIQTFKEDGEYLLKLGESRNMGDEDFVFRLKISEAQAGVDVFVTPANPQISKGNYAPLRIRANKKGGWDGDIEIVAKDLPKGFSADKCVLEKNSDNAFLILKASENIGEKFFTPSFVARAKIDGKDVEIPVKASEELTQAFFINHTLPMDRISVAALEKAPFRLEWGKDLPEPPLSINAGNTEFLNMKIIREPGFKGPVRIGVYRGARGLNVQQYQVKADEEEFQIRISANQNAQGTIMEDLYITANARKGKDTYMYVAPPYKYRVNGITQTVLTNKK